MTVDDLQTKEQDDTYIQYINFIINHTKNGAGI